MCQTLLGVKGLKDCYHPLKTRVLTGEMSVFKSRGTVSVPPYLSKTSKMTFSIIIETNRAILSPVEFLRILHNFRQ